jgi:hypothetical protein
LTARCFPSFDSCPVLCSCFPPALSSLTMGRKYWALEHVVLHMFAVMHKNEVWMIQRYSKCLPAKTLPRMKDVQSMRRRCQDLPYWFLFVQNLPGITYCLIGPGFCQAFQIKKWLRYLMFLGLQKQQHLRTLWT